jgi:hypothetical protein
MVRGRELKGREVCGSGPAVCKAGGVLWNRGRWYPATVFRSSILENRINQRLVRFIWGMREVHANNILTDFTELVDSVLGVLFGASRADNRDSLSFAFIDIVHIRWFPLGFGSTEALSLFSAELESCLETSYTSADDNNVCRDGTLSLAMRLNRTPKLVKSLIVNWLSGMRDGSSGGRTSTVLGSNFCT